MTVSTIISLLVFVTLLSCTTHFFQVSGEFCHGRPSPSAQPNTHPIGVPTPTFVSSVPNGQLYEVQVDDQIIPIVHLYGTPYEKGYAHGQLMKERMTGFMDQMMNYLITQAADAINKTGVPMPKALVEAQILVDAGLDLTSYDTQPFTGAYYGEEIQGMADSTGEDVNTIRRLQMLGEMTKGDCSMIGAWDQSLASGEGLLTVRALDYIMDGPFQNYHQMTIYHADPSNPLENSFLNVGWTGWIGSITGVNDQQMSIHEIGVSFPDASFGNESTQGIPFTYLLRDILQFDRTRMDGVSRVASAHRTCDLILGVGDGKDRRFNSIAYSADLCLIMDDTNMHPVNSTWHPVINGTVYHGMDWLCPNYNIVMAAQIESLWGQLTPAKIIGEILPIVQTGNLHAYVADLYNDQLYLSFAANDNSTSVDRTAFSRAWAQFDLSSLFATQLKDESNLIDSE